jgi:hypothetical protein
MLDRQAGILAFKKKRSSPSFLYLHRQHLAAKMLSQRLHSTVAIVISAVKKIKAHSLNSRLFHQLCEISDDESERLLLNTEARCLYKG